MRIRERLPGDPPLRLEATREVAAGAEAIPGVRVPGRSGRNLLGFASDEVSVVHVVELDPSQPEGDTFRGLLAMAGVTGGGLPARIAEIKEALNALPVPLREKLLAEPLDPLHRQREDG